MPNDVFYKSPEWRQLRKMILRRDGYRCSVSGCNTPANIVDHIVSPANGGKHTMNNLRSLCRVHDNQIKERPGRTARARDGTFIPICDVDGMPTDPAHPWALKRG